MPNDKEFCRQTRQIFAGILDVLQKNLTRYDGKRPIKRRGLGFTGSGGGMAAHAVCLLIG